MFGGVNDSYTLITEPNNNPKIITNDLILHLENNPTVTRDISGGNNLDVLFDSKAIALGDQVSLGTFEQIDFFQYFCTIHPWMQGKISSVPSILRVLIIEQPEWFTFVEEAHRNDGIPPR